MQPRKIFNIQNVSNIRVIITSLKPQHVTENTEIKELFDLEKNYFSSWFVGSLKTLNFYWQWWPEISGMIIVLCTFLLNYWSPWLKSDIDLLPSVQKRVLKMTSGLHSTSYLDQLKDVNLTTFEERRIRGDLIQTDSP